MCMVALRCWYHATNIFSFQYEGFVANQKYTSSASIFFTLTFVDMCRHEDSMPTEGYAFASILPYQMTDCPIYINKLAI